MSPERTFDIDKFRADVKATYDKYGRCVIAVSEGIHDADGTPIRPSSRATWSVTPTATCS